MYIKRLFFIFILSHCCSVTFASSKIDNVDSTKDSLINVYQKNISTLHYISRKTDNAKMFLTKTWDYTDSLLNLSDDNRWVDSVRSQLELTTTTCEENLNHKVQFFPFLIGEIDYLGFADDAIEYAHDKALSKLLLTQFNFGLHFNTVQDLNLSSIIINDNCDDEMFEIIKQTIISNTKHHILSLPDFFIKKNVSEDSLMMSKICDYYGLKRLGIFESSDIDNINNKLFLAKSSFKIFDVETGFTETIYNKGFSYDKRGVWFLNFIWLVLFGVFSITIFSFFEEQILKVLRLRKMIFQTSFRDILYSFWRLLRLVLSSFFLPFFLSLFIVYLFSFLTPSGYDHYLERTSILWMISLTLGMAFIPLLMNLFFINRLDLDGFHSDKGYRVFANTSLYATYLPLFIFYIIQYEVFPLTEIVFLVIVTFLISYLLSKGYSYLFKKNTFLGFKMASGFSFLIAAISLCLFNSKILIELSYVSVLQTTLILLPLIILDHLFDRYITSQDTKSIEDSNNSHNMRSNVFVSNVINFEKSVCSPIINSFDNNSLTIKIISGFKGIGKTRLLYEVKKKLLINKDIVWYYSDCNEIQDSTMISYEPFVEAFGDLLGTDEFKDHSELTEKIAGSVSKIIDSQSPFGDIINGDFIRDGGRNIVESVASIVEQLEKQNKKIVFVIEDIHWIDPETREMLRVFLDIASRNVFLLNNMCLVLSIRSSLYSEETRGFQNTDEIIDFLNSLQINLDVKEIISNVNFNINDFLFNLSNQNPEFTIQNDSLNELNLKFNELLSEKDKPEITQITPLYILTTLEIWINEGILKPTSSTGYILTDFNINLPSDKDLDKYYHDIFHTLDSRWIRLLESAAVLGFKFNASTLADLWSYKLLDVLIFLEKAQDLGLVKDLSSEDNFYEFTNNRIPGAILSYFRDHSKLSKGLDSQQIILEYNKRFLDTQKDLFQNPERFHIEELLSLIRVWASLNTTNSEADDFDIKRLILDVVLRLTYEEEFDKLRAFSQFLRSKQKTLLSSILDVILDICAHTTISPNQYQKSVVYLYSQKVIYNSLEHHLKIYGLLMFSSFPSTNRQHEIFLKEPYVKPLIKEDINLLSDLIYGQYYKDISLLRLGVLYMNYCSKHHVEFFHSIMKERLGNSNLVTKINDIDNLKINFFDFLEDSVKKSYQYVYLKLIIDRLRFSIENVSEDVENSYAKHINLLIEAENLQKPKLITAILKLIYNLIKNDQEKIQNYIEHCKKLEKINFGDWIQVKLLLFSRKSYLYNSVDDAHETLSKVKSFLINRYDIDGWNELLEQYFVAEKKLYYNIAIKSENPDDFEKYGELCESHLQKISNYLGKSNYLYAQACVNYADYYAVTNRPEEGIQHLLEATFVREKSHEKDPQPYIMSWYYQKVSSYYRFHLTDGANAKKYADLNIDILNRMEDVPQYKWNTAFFELAKIYTLLKEYSKSIDYFDKVTWKKGTFDDMSTWSWNGLILELNKNYALSYIKNDKKIIEETNLIINELLSEKYSAFAQNVTTRKRIQEVKDRISLIQ